MLAVGSIMHNANYNSYIWGSGFISPNHIPKKLDTQKIRALRGKKSFLLIKENYDCNFKDVPLGDPGLIMPTLYTPAPNEKKYKLGIIPHYIDINKIPETVHSDNCVKVLNVMQEPEKFIDELCQCENIISSSLHGLILSDAYGIRNKWAIFSNKIVGGGFKFLDYYSTTESPNEAPLILGTEKEIQDITLNYNTHTSVKRYIYNIKDLIDNFPNIE